VVHQPVSRGFAVFADAWLSGWLAEISADLLENGSALEVVLHDYALYKSTFTLLTLLYLHYGPFWLYMTDHGNFGTAHALYHVTLCLDLK